MRGCGGEAPPEFSGEGGAWFIGLWVGAVCVETFLVSLCGLGGTDMRGPGRGLHTEQRLFHICTVIPPR